MSKRKGVSARGWFYRQSFHSIQSEAEADGAIAQAFLELASDKPTQVEPQPTTKKEE